MSTNTNRSQRMRAQMARLSIQGKQAAELVRFSLSELSSVLQLKPLLPQLTTLNRYKRLIDQIQQMLHGDDRTIERQDVLRFAQKFFEIVNTDIRVLQGNELIRQQIVRLNSRILVYEKQMAFTSAQTLLATSEVRTKQQYVDCLSLSFSSYHKKVVSLKHLYEEVAGVQIATSLDLQPVYDPKSVNEEYYLSYQNPLLEVLYRMKRTMEGLGSEIRLVGNMELQARSVNFLANCQNLMLELENFLLSKTCVFNRLLSYMVVAQKANLDRVIRLCRQHYTIHNDLQESLEKCYFMLNVFDEEVGRINVQRLRNDIDNYMLQGFSRDNGGTVPRFQAQFAEMQASLKQIRSFLCSRNAVYLVEYSKSLLNGRVRKLLDLQASLAETVEYFTKLLKLANPNDQFTFQIKRVREEAGQMQTRVRAIQNNSEPFNQQIFKQLFLKMQDQFTLLHRLRTQLEEYDLKNMNPQLRKYYVTDRQQLTQELLLAYFGCEQALVAVYEQQRETLAAQLGETITNCESTLSATNNFMQVLDYQPQPNIKTWDRAQAENIKRYLSLIKKSEIELGMLQNTSGDPSLQQKKEQLTAEIKKTLFQFESLYLLYDTEIVATVLENIIKEASFEARDYTVRISDHAEFEQQIDKYLKNLRRVVADPALPVNIARMFSDRLRVLSEVKLLYQLMFKVYREVMSTPYPKDLQKKQLQLKDKQLLQYLGLLTRAAKDLKNNSTALDQEVTLTAETKDFLKRVIEEFITNFELFFGVDAVELQNYTRLMGLGQDFTAYADQAIAGFNKAADMPVDPSWAQNVVNAARQLAEINYDIQDLYKLENGKLGKLNFGTLKDEVKKKAEWLALADAVVREYEANNVQLRSTYKDSKVENLRKKLLTQLASAQ